VTERGGELVRYGPDGAPQALLEAREIAESIGAAAASDEDDDDRTTAMLMVWCGLAAANPGHSARFIAQAESAAALISGNGPVWAIRLARALAAHDADGAVRFAESVPDQNARSRALATVAGEIAADEPERAEYLARGISDPRQRVSALATVATRVARQDPAQTERLAAEAETVADKELPDQTRSAALCEVIEATAAVDLTRAGRLAGQLPSDDIGEIRKACAILAVAWAGTDPDLAERLARSQEQPAHQAVALAQVAAALLPANPPRAAVLVTEADALAATVRDKFGASSILTALTYQRMASAFASADAARALNYAHAVATAPETALVKVDTLVGIATAVPPPRPAP
jgi:hypothetical protein